MQSAITHPKPVEDYLQAELQAGRIVGPLPATVAIHTSRFGVIPKSGQPNKWRLILDLSSPRGHSVNDAISKDLCSLRYATVDQAVHRIVELGPGSRLAKIDIEHAFRNIPIHPDDRKYLGMTWRGNVYVDTVLPFGLRSAPKIFSAVADALEWTLLSSDVTWVIHYLDDFLTLGPPSSDECQDNLDRIIATCNRLGLPLKHDKVEGPATSLIFLGILLDTSNMEMRLPETKLLELKLLITSWAQKRTVRKRALLSLIGKLSHAAKIVIPGRTFLRRMIDTACKARHLDHWIHLLRRLSFGPSMVGLFSRVLERPFHDEAGSTTQQSPRHVDNRCIRKLRLWCVLDRTRQVATTDVAKHLERHPNTLQGAPADCLGNCHLASMLARLSHTGALR